MTEARNQPDFGPMVDGYARLTRGEMTREEFFDRYTERMLELAKPEPLDRSQAFGKILEAFYQMTRGKLSREEYAKLRFNTLIKTNQRKGPK